MAQFAAETLTLVIVSAVALSGQSIRNVPRVTIDELKTLMDQKTVLVIDVRDPESFAKRRIPGAVNLDYTQVLKEGGRFPIPNLSPVVSVYSNAYEVLVLRLSSGRHGPANPHGVRSE